jgi:ABC-type branched-subunit amino acid transport system substrate-binding protein
MSELLVRYRALYHDTPAETFGVTQAYDAFYLIAYAIARVRNDDVKGTDVHDGLRAILFGPNPQPVNVGPEGIDAAFAAILAGRGIDLQGASGKLAFDASTGTPTSDVQVSCIQSGTPPATSSFTPAGLAWKAATSVLTGALKATCAP